MPEIGVVVIHGIGEQRRIETLTSVVSHFYRALEELQVSDLARTLRLQDPPQPAMLTFSHNGTPYAVRFYEAYWADLDQPYTFVRWLKLVWWGLTIWREGYFEPPPPNMRLIDVGRPRRLLTRLWLLVLSGLFLVVLLTLRVLNQAFLVLFRRPLRLGQTLYNFLGDVQLFLGEEIRYDALEALGRKSRYAIRTRLWEVLARAHLDPVQDVYLLAHSLGTVVAFNAFMEPAERILSYIDDGDLRQKLHRAGLIDGHGVADRETLLSKVRALFTLGSPLDKFAGIWPRVIPVNVTNPRPAGTAIQWFNIHDPLDIVGASLDHFTGVPGLTAPRNFCWRDQPLLATAHTSYWKQTRGGNRFIDRFAEYLLDSTPIERRPFVAPDNRPFLTWGPLFLAGLAMNIYLVGGLVTLISVYIRGADWKLSQVLGWFTAFF